MNIKTLFVLALSGILVGCVSPTPRFAGSQVGGITLSFAGCTSLPVVPCTGDENDPKVTVNLDTWVVTPECINAKKGKTITFTLESASVIEKGSVILFPKKLENNFWVARTNSPNKNKIKVRVPTKKKSGDAFPVGVYDYGISTPAKCLDPRINVDN
ncbi:MAG: hypothetical protein OEQ90_06080 [Gammaproteobacteria bacterium]|nr:hypothetical protein [Gammaproteobacteria bacterium]